MQKESSISKVKWNITDVLSVIILELLIFYASIPIMRLIEPINESYRSIFVLGAYMFQISVSLGLIYAFTIYKYKVRLKDFGFQKIKLWESFKFVFTTWILTLFVLGGLSFVLTLIFGDSIPGFMSQEEHLPMFGENTLGYSFLILSAFIIAPIVEEVMFRGFVLQGLMKYLTPLSSVLISALLFSVLHFEFMSVIPLFIIGSVLGYIFVKRNSLFECLIFHALNNGFAVMLELFLHFN